MGLGSGQPSVSNEGHRHAIDGSEHLLISEYLVNDALTPDNGMDVDGSVVPVEFSFEVPERRVLHVGRMLLYMETGTAFDSIKFANLPALTNGLQLENNGEVLENWKDNVDIVTTLFDAEEGAAFGKSGRILRCRWTFWKATTTASSLILRPEEKFKAIVQDDLSTMDVFRIKIQGVLERA